MRILAFVKKETVLSIAVLLAVASAFVIVPDRAYLDYIDFRTLGILFCLMTIVAGLRETGVFDRIADRLLKKVKGITGIAVILVFLCFFSSMLITNDVALITFVPLTILIMGRMDRTLRQRFLIPCVVLQTIAANLGSMLTPIGNPQNLYLYGKSGMKLASFLKLMLPYTAVSLILLLVWILLIGRRNKIGQGKAAACVNHASDQTVCHAARETKSVKSLVMYLCLFAVSLLSVGRLLPVWIPFGAVLLYSMVFNPRLLRKVDYALLGTFVALFIFIGNLGRISRFSHFLQNVIQGREILTAAAASQVMSNVPAAVLLAGFTDQYEALIVGTNLGGLGTLIASMASLISFKYIAREEKTLRGRYLLYFTAANLVFLAILLLMAAGCH